MASSTANFKSRQAYKAAKELEEARKAGTAPPEVDSNGEIINPHIPEYISQAPWYVASDGPSLDHQRNHNASKRKFSGLGEWLPRGQTVGAPATKYRKGACTNCGAMTHNAKGCLERPRRRGAKLTGRGIHADELVGHVELNFEGKRDRWNGYNVADFERVHARYRKLDDARQTIKAERLDSALRDGAPPADEQDDDGPSGDGTVVHETGDGAKTTVRNLRIREDTAKYLYNLQLNSAHYDPKSRSMRADPRPNANPDDKDFLGDNFVRHTGDVVKLSRMEEHGLRARDAGRRLPHLQAEPSRAEVVFKEYEAKKNAAEEKRREEIAKKYGGQEHSKTDAVLAAVRQSERYVEYDDEGKILTAAVGEVVPVSRYVEDVLEKNHSAIWGSFFEDGRWGYACCWQTQRLAVCTGEAGRRAARDTAREMGERLRRSKAKRDARPLVEQWQQLVEEKAEGEAGAAAKPAPREQREKRVLLEREIRRQDEEERRAVADDERRGYNSRRRREEEEKVSDAAMEAFRIRRQMQDDPMAKFLSNK